MWRVVLEGTGYGQWPRYVMPGAVVLCVWTRCSDNDGSWLQDVAWVCYAGDSGAVCEYGLSAQTMQAHGCETGIDSVIVIEIYEYIFQEIELIGGFLARI